MTAFTAAVLGLLPTRKPWLIMPASTCMTTRALLSSCAAQRVLFVSRPSPSCCQSLSIELDTPPNVKAAANLFRAICYQNKNALMAGIIIAGWDPVEGGQVYAIPLGGTMVRQKVAFGGTL